MICRRESKLQPRIMNYPFHTCAHWAREVLTEPCMIFGEIINAL